MNNLVFNTVANELKTSIYGMAPDLSIQPIRVDGSGLLLVSGSLTISDNITVSAILGPVTIGNASLTVAGEVEITNTSLTVAGQIEITNASLTVDGTVEVSEITSPVTIGNASLTVSGEVEITNASLTVEGTVEVSEITSPVTIGNASLTVAGTVTVSEISSPVTIGGNAFFEDSVIDEEITGTGVLFDDTDISALKVASIFVYNDGAAPVSLSLQVSPTAEDARYIDDPNYTDVVIDGNEGMYISVTLFARYVRLQYDMGVASTTVSAYFIGQA